MSSGATCSAGRQKKDWGRCWEGVVAMGVAWGMSGGYWERGAGDVEHTGQANGNMV
jgi:hypothetical protein